MDFYINMVRIIAGTLVEVGLGKIEPTEIPKIIESKNREKAGKTLQPQGLYLVKVEYETKKQKISNVQYIFLYIIKIFQNFLKILKQIVIIFTKKP